MILEMVRKNPPKIPLPRISQLSLAQQLQAEDQYNMECIQWAHQNLDM
jgi:hypothetical protein